MARILVIDPHRTATHLIRRATAGYGHRLLPVLSLHDGLAAIENSQLDLCVLSAAVQRPTLAAVIADVRDQSSIPIIVVADVVWTRDAVEAFQAGADDVVPVAANPDILGARVNALIRRADWAFGKMREPTFQAMDFTMDFGEHTLTVRGQSVWLSRLEWRILALLVERAGKIVTNQALIGRLWGGNASPTLLRVEVRYVRRKIEENPSRPRLIETVKGIGYRFTLEPLPVQEPLQTAAG